MYERDDSLKSSLLSHLRYFLIIDTKAEQYFRQEHIKHMVTMGSEIKIVYEEDFLLLVVIVDMLDQTVCLG